MAAQTAKDNVVLNHQIVRSKLALFLSLSLPLAACGFAGCGGETVVNDIISDAGRDAAFDAADDVADGKVNDAAFDVAEEDVAPPLVQEFLPPAPLGKAWQIAWHDEFNGTQIDESKWTVEGGTEAAPQQRREGFWVKEAMTLDGQGNMVMATYIKNYKYMDGVMSTQGKFEHTYGYYEARMKVATQPGHWGAFWLMPESFGDTTNGGVDGVEIDIMERPWAGAEKQSTNHALHWDSYAAGSDDSMVSTTMGIEIGYHTFGLWWAEDMYRFYIDGIMVWETKAGGICTVPLYIIFSDEIASNFFAFSGSIEDAELPDYTYVDYVRVYDLVSQ
jgi:beta-glucanase (GH16 family)